MKNEINSYFRSITPVRSDEEILRGVLGKAEEMENKTIKQKFSIRRPLIAVCAAVGALSLGVTGAAAAGIINFNEIFDKRISVQDEALGEALLCSAENFTYTISDEEYQIEMQGLTGTENDIIGTLVISRKDGAPVTDYMEAISRDDRKLVFATNCEIYPSEKYADYCVYGGASSEYYTDNDGNLKIEFSVVSYSNMYNNRIYISEQRKYSKLPFEWSVEFVYTPSETSVERLYRGYFTVDDKIPVTYCVSDAELRDSVEDFDTTADIEYIELNSLSGTVKGTAKLSDEFILKAVGRESIDMENFDVYLTKKDGSTVHAFVESGGYTNTRFTLTLAYISSDYDELIESGTLLENCIAVDLSEIQSITINGKTFDMQ